MIPGFHRVRRPESCPICGKHDWCLIADDDSAAICPRVPSQRRWGKAGWWHRIAANARRPIPTEFIAPAESESRFIDCRAILQRYIADTTTVRLERFARILGVSVVSLKRLGAAWSSNHQAWAFPMRPDIDAEPCGIRLRAEDGSKWAVRNSREGLFIPASLLTNEKIHRLLICEGPTDCAALLDLGYHVVGRPSCRGCVQEILNLIRKLRCSEVMIMADRDTPKLRPDGSSFLPGKEGAEELAQKIWRPVKIVYPPKHKDWREWKQNGATKGLVDAIIRVSRWFCKTAQTPPQPNRSYAAPARSPEGQSVQSGSDVIASGSVPT